MAGAGVADAYVSAAAARVPLAVVAPESAAPQPAFGVRELRHARRLLPLGPRRTSPRALSLRPDRRMDPDLPLRAALRPLDGLRVLPRHTQSRRMGARTRHHDRRHR